jgi:hypothetical protein
MSASEILAQKQFLNRKILTRMAIGAVIGAAVGYGFIETATLLQVSIKQLTWSDGLAYWLGVTYLGAGLVFYAITYNRRELARSLEGEQALLPATNDEVHIFRLQALTLLLAGVLILLPLVAMGSLGNTTQRAANVFTCVVALWIVQTWINIRVWRAADEFARLLLLKASAIAFGVFQGALFLWAAAEHLHLARRLSTWDSMMILMTVYLVTSSILAVKHRPGT